MKLRYKKSEMAVGVEPQFENLLQKYTNSAHRDVCVGSRNQPTTEVGNHKPEPTTEIEPTHRCKPLLHFIYQNNGHDFGSSSHFAYSKTTAEVSEILVSSVNIHSSSIYLQTNPE